MKKVSICSIVAVGPYDVIGLNGSMPWHSRQDFFHFKNVTTPYPCIFGRNTYDNMPKKPLPNRLNIVCSSRYPDELKDGVFYASNIEKAIDFAKNNTDKDKIFICGGSMIYKYALENDLIDIMYLTKIKDDALKQSVLENKGAYTYFPVETLEFFTSPKWETEKIIYSDGILPAETSPVTPIFYKSIRVR